MNGKTKKAVKTVVTIAVIAALAVLVYNVLYFVFNTTAEKDIVAECLADNTIGATDLVVVDGKEYGYSGCRFVINKDGESDEKGYGQYLSAYSEGSFGLIKNTGRYYFSYGGSGKISEDFPAEMHTISTKHGTAFAVSSRNPYGIARVELVCENLNGEEYTKSFDVDSYEPFICLSDPLDPAEYSMKSVKLINMYGNTIKQIDY